MHEIRTYRSAQWDLREMECCHSIHEYSALHIKKRGLTKDELSPDHEGHLHDPRLLKSMPEGLDALQDVIRRKAHVLVWGDYDVDGTVGTTVAVQAMLERHPELHDHINYFIPDRVRDGYGVAEKYAKSIADQGNELLWTIDCGIREFAGLEALAARNVLAFVNDHHLPDKDRLPPGIIVDPKQTGCTYPDKNGSGCSVAAKTLEGLFGRPFVVQRFADLIALALVADVVPLRGETRHWVKLGLEKARKDPHPAIVSLCEDTNRDMRMLMAEDFAFGLAPLINASSSRIRRKPGMPNPAMQLLLGGDPGAVVSMVHDLDMRRSLQIRALNELDACIAGRGDRHILILIGEDREVFNEGMNGLHASYLVDKTSLPAFVLGYTDRGFLKGSGRGNGHYHLHDALDGCKDVLIAYGGHADAAGVTVHPEKVHEFRWRMENHAREHLTPEQCVHRIAVEVSMDTPTFGSFIRGNKREELWEALSDLSPFGKDNDSLVILLERVLIKTLTPFGKLGRHIALNTEEIGQVKGFFMGMPDCKKLQEQQRYDMLVTLRQSGCQIEVQLKDIRQTPLKYV